jgi:DNA modification methylase
MKILDIKIEKLKLAEYNPRIISDKELTNLKKSLEKFGFIQAVVINKDFTVISGHQRIRAWQEMKHDTVPTIQLDITPKEEKALNLAMNKIGGDWDTEKLFNIMNELRVADELEFTGFDEKEVSKILDQFLEEDEEEPVSELLEKLPSKAKLGQIYELGNHRLMCGDSTSLDDVQKLTEKRLMNMVWTDPPYNVNYKSSNEKLGSIKNDNMSASGFSEFSLKVFECLSAVTRPGGVFYVCTGWQSFATFQETMSEAGVHLSEVIIWVKNQAGIHTLEYPHKHEQIIKAKNVGVSKKKKGKAILYGWKEGKHQFFGDRSDYDVWEVDKRETGKYVHPTEKPDWLIMKALKNSTKFKDNVIDLFGGSGSALMACEKMGRNAFLMELDPRFVDVIIYRWEKYTKRKAKKLN